MGPACRKAHSTRQRHRAADRQREEDAAAWVLLRDGERATLEKGMTFTVDKGDVIELQIWDRDTSALSFFKNQDDQLATVTLETNKAPLGRQTLRDRNGSTLMVEVHQ